MVFGPGLVRLQTLWLMTCLSHFHVFLSHIGTEENTERSSISKSKLYALWLSYLTKCWTYSISCKQLKRYFSNAGLVEHLWHYIYSFLLLGVSGFGKKRLESIASTMYGNSIYATYEISPLLRQGLTPSQKGFWG